jgi:hypothetical protein
MDKIRLGKDNIRMCSWVWFKRYFVNLFLFLMLYSSCVAAATLILIKELYFNVLKSSTYFPYINISC